MMLKIKMTVKRWTNNAGKKYWGCHGLFFFWGGTLQTCFNVKIVEKKKHFKNARELIFPKFGQKMPHQAAYVEATCNANCIGLVKLTFGSSGSGKLPGHNWGLLDSDARWNWTEHPNPTAKKNSYEIRMGRHSGFIALHAGLAARNADIVLLPEMTISSWVANKASRWS